MRCQTAQEFVAVLTWQTVHNEAAHILARHIHRSWQAPLGHKSAGVPRQNSLDAALHCIQRAPRDGRHAALRHERKAGLRPPQPLEGFALLPRTHHGVSASACPRSPAGLHVAGEAADAIQADDQVAHRDVQALLCDGRCDQQLRTPATKVVQDRSLLAPIHPITSSVANQAPRTQMCDHTLLQGIGQLPGHALRLNEDQGTEVLAMVLLVLAYHRLDLHQSRGLLATPVHELLQPPRHLRKRRACR
mmetsp:Transcript_129347/g.413314  ORF Transcript_129347/g.413314 Transcript_129347/m.413314 type:complete len:247 (-) Transcript_129347:692-1432(-)